MITNPEDKYRVGRLIAIQSDSGSVYMGFVSSREAGGCLVDVIADDAYRGSTVGK